MQRRLRLTGERRHTAVHQEGRSWANHLLVLRALPNGLDHSRFGVVAGRRVGNAVVRNRVKRRLREGLRASRVKPGWDTIIIARKGAAEVGYHQLYQALGNLLGRSRLLLSPQLRDDSGD